MSSFNWTCPTCGAKTTIVDSQCKSDYFIFNMNNNHEKDLAFYTEVIVCPNQECRHFVIVNTLCGTNRIGPGVYRPNLDETILKKQFLPRTSSIPIPDYVPKAITEDYQEACLIVNESPKAAAALCRRCLQGMIRDFWKINKEKLSDQINGLKEILDEDSWNAVDSIRSIGNIGAHMEKDVGLIIDIDVDEGKLLISMIELFIEEWYIKNHEKEMRLKKIKAIADEKKLLKKA